MSRNCGFLSRCKIENFTKFLFFKRNTGLLKKSSPLMFNNKVNFSSVTNFMFKEISSEFLDYGDFKDIVFSRYDNVCFDYDNVCFDYDSKFYYDLDFKNSVFNILPNVFGREFAKTCSFRAEGEVILEILSGSGVVLLENPNSGDVKVIKVIKGDFVVVSKDFYFVLINSSESDNFVVFSLFSKKYNLETLGLSNFNGANLFYTTSGLIRNLNSRSNYILENYEGGFVSDYLFNKELGLYKEVLSLPEKFNFLK